MAISTDTSVLRIEGRTDGAVAATNKLREAQQKLKQQVDATGASFTSAAQAAALVPASASPSGLGKVGAAIKSLGFDTQTFSAGLRDIGKGLTFDLIRTGLKGLNADLQGTAGAMLSASVNGASMGAAFGGPLGAAIGAVAGGLVGLIRGTETHTEAELRAAAAAKKHAAALQLVADGETKIRGQRRGTREAEDLAYAEYDAASMKNTQIGSEASAADLERARRAWRDAMIERQALNRADGVIWLEEQKRQNARIDAIQDVEAARRKGTLTDEEAAQRLKDLNKVQTESLDIVEQMRHRQEETAKAVDKLNKALQAGRVNAKEYNDLLRSVDEDYRARDDARKKRQEDANRRWQQRQAERQALIKSLTKKDFEQGTDALEQRLQAEDDERVASGALAGFTPSAPMRGIPVPRDTSRWSQQDVNKYNANDRKSRLASMFGSIDEINSYKTAFDGLTGAVTAGMQAWISGSESAGQAIKKFLSSYLAGIAATMAIDALKEGAAAIASLAWYDYPGAAAHAKAAAAYGAGSAAAAVAARALGGGGSTPSGGGGGGGGGGGALGGGASPSLAAQREQQRNDMANRQTNVNIIMGDASGDSTPRMLRLKAERTWERARGTTGTVQE